MPTTLKSLNEKNGENSVEVKSHCNVVSIIFQFLLSAILGFIFGWSMEKSKVYEPTTIKDQMIFKKFIMLKMFFAALGTSTLSILILSFFFKQKYNQVFESYESSLKNKSFFIIIIGGSLLGIGMQISGACPGMVLVQLGAGVPWSWLTLIGALYGALIHGLLNSSIMKDVKGDLILSKTINEFFFNIHSAFTRVGFILLLSISVFLMEYFIPWTDEYKNGIDESTTNIMIYKAWSPSICGVLLGSLQFFSILFLGKSLGTSSSYSTLVGIPFLTKKLQNKFQYLSKFRSGITNWLTVVFILSAILGGFASSYSSGVFAKSTETHPYNSFFGGFLMVFGARIAGGCTSGHGISGASHQFLASFLAIISMFSSAIFIGFYVDFSR